MSTTDTWQAYSCEVFRLISNLSDSLYEFEKERIAIEKKVKEIEEPEKREQLNSLLSDAESALMDIEEKFGEFAAIGNFIDEKLI